MSAALDLRSKEEKDAELDKRIEALRKKNEALIKRYQEIEEDRKKAEQEGGGVTAVRRARPPDDEGPSVAAQVVPPPGERRAKDKKPSGPPKAGRGSGRGGPASVCPSHAGGATPGTAVGGGGRWGDPGDRGGRSRRSRGRGVAAAGGDGGPDRKSKVGGLGPRSGFWGPHGFSGGAPCAISGVPGVGDVLGGRMWGVFGGPGCGWGGVGALSGCCRPPRQPLPPPRSGKERRRQNIERMNEEMAKIAAYERSRRDGLPDPNPVRSFLDDPRRSGPPPPGGTDRREGSRRHARNWGGADFRQVTAGLERDKTPGRPRPPPAAPLDMTLAMTGRERAEYARWKEERERIDRERLARHREPTGRWRREWDADKADGGFREGLAPPASAGQENAPFPPKPPSPGDFVAPHRARRRRRGRGAATQPYSAHDDRWEQKEPPRESRQAEEAPSGPPPGPPSSLSPEEDDDQWEDVSEEEEEEEEGGGSGSSSEADAPHSVTPEDQQPPGRWGGAEPPPSPFSPMEGPRPVSDWGEEMDGASPRSSLGGGDSPPAAPGEAPGLSPGELVDPPGGRRALRDPPGGRRALRDPPGGRRARWDPPGGRRPRRSTRRRRRRRTSREPRASAPPPSPARWKSRASSGRGARPAAPQRPPRSRRDPPPSSRP
ncbi:LOW QUALITY PROTEIN: coiled-coil domain-containing protein 9 [Phalacrocorax carbo]|uniref:LOW QUALITY PROTEIN: coiled-coil domain-containing protein 9 n=1 Tax=Phalacrocorax carbo TaxID=9209 RepID=UPI00311A62BD